MRIGHAAALCHWLASAVESVENSSGLVPQSVRKPVLG